MGGGATGGTAAATCGLAGAPPGAAVTRAATNGVARAAKGDGARCGGRGARGVAGLSAFPWQMMVGAIFPLVLGMILGNLDKDMREFLKAAPAVLIPFFAFALGAGLDLSKVWNAGLLGVGLGVCVVAITGVVLFFGDRLTGGTGVAGLAASSTAGNAAAVPMIIAQANPVYAEAAQHATILVAACVVVTAILTPLVTAWGVKTFGAPKDVPAAEGEE